MQRSKVYIYGKHALVEALTHAPQAIKKVYCAPEMSDKHIRDLLVQKRVPVAALKQKEMAKNVSADASHQGVIAVMDPAALLVPFESFIETLDTDKNPALVLLNELQDPHNVGAIIRSAAAFGISGVLIPEHNQAPITGAVVKTSAGMAFRVPLVAIGNTNNTIRVLKEKFFTVYGLAMDGSRDVSEEKFDTPALFIVGNESKGIREKTLALCDTLLRIPMHPRCESLNAAVSTAIVLHEWSSQHPEVLI